MSTKNKIIIIIVLCGLAYFKVPQFKGIADGVIGQIRFSINNISQNKSVDPADPVDPDDPKSYDKSTLTFNPRRGRTD